MAYSTSNPPFRIWGGTGNGFAGSTLAQSTAFTGYVGASGGGAGWVYVSSDPVGTVTGSSYFTDGFQRGMRLHDIVGIVDIGQGSSAFLTFTTVKVVTTGTTVVGGVTLTTGNLGSSF